MNKQIKMHEENNITKDRTNRLCNWSNSSLFLFTLYYFLYSVLLYSKKYDETIQECVLKY